MVTKLDQAKLESVLPEAIVAAYRPDDLAELVVLQRCCWVQEAIANETLQIPALHETSEEVADWATTWTMVVVRQRVGWSRLYADASWTGSGKSVG